MSLNKLFCSILQFWKMSWVGKKNTLSNWMTRAWIVMYDNRGFLMCWEWTWPLSWHQNARWMRRIEFGWTYTAKCPIFMQPFFSKCVCPQGQSTVAIERNEHYTLKKTHLFCQMLLTPAELFCVKSNFVYKKWFIWEAILYPLSNLRRMTHF